MRFVKIGLENKKASQRLKPLRQILTSQLSDIIRRKPDSTVVTISSSTERQDCVSQQMVAKILKFCFCQKIGGGIFFFLPSDNF